MIYGLKFLGANDMKKLLFLCEIENLMDYIECRVKIIVGSGF